MAHKPPQAALRHRSAADADEQLRLVLDATCSNAWDWDLVTGAVHFSDQWLASLGYTRAEISPTAEFWQSLVHPDDWPRVEAALNAYLAGTTPGYECENRLRTRAGRYRPNLDRGKVVAWDADGKPLRMVGVDLDLTATQTLKAELVATLQRLVMATEIGGIGIWELDIATRTFTWNDQMYAIYGIAPDEVIDEARWLATIHPDDLPGLQAQRNMTLTTGQSTAMEFRIRRPDGSIRATQGSRGPRYDTAGNIVGMVGVCIDITERKAAERERIFLSALFESSPDAIIGREVDGTIRSWNPGAEELFGYTADEAIGKNLVMLAAPDEHDFMRQMLEQVACGTPVQGVETQRMAKDGRIFDCLISSFPVRDAAGSIIGVASFATDISDRKRAEAALRQSEARFAAAFYTNPAPICILRLTDGCYVDANPAYLALVGHRREELIGRSPTALGIVAVAQRAELIATARREGRVRDLETHIFAKDGRRIDLVSSYEPIERDGEDCRLIVSIDITARLEAQAQLRDSLQRLRLATEAAEIGVWTWNFADGSLDWDARMCAMYGVPEELSSSGISYDVWKSRVHPEDLAIAELPYGLVSELTRRWEGTYRIIRPDGEVRHIYVSSIVECDARGEPLRMIGVNRDVTEQKRFEELLQGTNAESERRVAVRTAELRAAIAELQRANSAKDAFMAAVSHELRTPMTGIIGMTEALESQVRGPLNEEQLHYLATLRASAERLLHMINGVLEYASAVSDSVPPAREICHTAELCAISVHRARPKAEKKQQTLELQIEPLEPVVLSDSGTIVKILDALLDNAIKFTPANGRIGIGVASEGDTVRLTVWDTGIGISKQQIPLLFQPLTQVDWRLSRQHGGIGLGLAYVHRMVEMLGGNIGVESTPGEGSRFTVTLSRGM